MVLLEQLRIHVGGLVCLKTELYWYGGRGWDGCPGRICLLMDATADPKRLWFGAGAYHAATADARIALGRRRGDADAATLLLIDGCPYWVWIAPADLELI